MPELVVLRETYSEEERVALAVRAHHEVLWLHTQLSHHLLEELSLTLLGKQSSCHDYRYIH